MAKYKIKESFKGSPDGMQVIEFTKGQEVELTGELEEVAAEEGWVVELVEEFSEPQEFDDARIQDIVSAIGLLEEGNEDHWTNTGKPEIAVLKTIMEGKVSGDERDAAWLVAQSAGS